jgi:hypothetical protein
VAISKSVFPLQAFPVKSNIKAVSLPWSKASGASLGQALALFANIRLVSKDLPGTNTIAYYKHSLITTVKSFILLVPGVEVLNFFLRH